MTWLLFAAWCTTCAAAATWIRRSLHQPPSVANRITPHLPSQRAALDFTEEYATRADLAELAAVQTPADCIHIWGGTP